METRGARGGGDIKVRKVRARRRGLARVRAQNDGPRAAPSASGRTRRDCTDRWDTTRVGRRHPHPALHPVRGVPFTATEVPGPPRASREQNASDSSLAVFAAHTPPNRHRHPHHPPQQCLRWACAVPGATVTIARGSACAPSGMSALRGPIRNLGGAPPPRPTPPIRPRSAPSVGARPGRWRKTATKTGRRVGERACACVLGAPHTTYVAAHLQVHGPLSKRRKGGGGAGPPGTPLGSGGGAARRRPPPRPA